VIDELHLPVCDAPAAEHPRTTVEEYDRWVNGNLMREHDRQKLERLRSQLSRQPVNARFRLVQD
jgi:hypothetical protein